MSALLSVTRVSKRFRGLVAVDAVSFDVPEGVIFAVIGPNGAGKTTLFNMIAGAMAPDEGAIAFAGQQIGGLTPDAVCRRGVARTRGVGKIFQRCIQPILKYNRDRPSRWPIFPFSGQNRR